jgi:tRNA U38,U39,U40 pseudouridine synthase TruA
LIEYELLIQKLAKATVNTESTTVSRESTVSTNTLENVFGSSFGKSIIRSMTTSVVRNVTGQITRGILGAIMGKKR